jgi:hypothetical protein
MLHKISRCVIAATIIFLIIPFYCFGQYKMPEAFNLTGKIVSPLYAARISVFYAGGNDPPAVYNFIITKSTQIIGTLKVGADVNITFKRRRRPDRSSKRVALVIEVKGDAPQGATLYDPKRLQ